jgi:hypothetical protein
MADQKVFDMVVTVGSFITREGNEKKQYKTIGSVYKNDKGMYAVMDKFFNPAAVSSDRNTFIAGFYEPKEWVDKPKQAQPQQGNDFNDDIPW